MGTQSRNGEGVLKSEDVELKKVDLTKFFDEADLNIGAIGE